MTQNKIRIVLIITLVTLSLVTQATAQERSSTSYTGLQVLLPDGDMANLFDTGFGLTGTWTRNAGRGRRSHRPSWTW